MRFGFNAPKDVSGHIEENAERIASAPLEVGAAIYPITRKPVLMVGRP